MQVVETLNQGLKRKLSVTIPAQDLLARRDRAIEDLRPSANLKGFRPGKAPIAHLRKVYGRSAMSEAMQEAINNSVQQTLTDRGERSASQPKIDMSEDQAVINRVINGEQDLAFDISYEVLPAVNVMDLRGIAVTRPIIELNDEDLEREFQRFFMNQRGFTEKPADQTAQTGDRLGVSFTATIDGKPFEGSKSEHAHLIIGDGSYIPGFDTALIGMKKDEKREFDVTFPPDHRKPELAGKTAHFHVTMLHIDAPNEGELNDAFAQKLGLDNVEALREFVRNRMVATHDAMVRQYLKRQILDALDEAHKFEVPEQLVEAEFNAIWQRVMHEIEQHGRDLELEGTSDEAAKAQYRTIAERRVRLGLVVAEIGNTNKIEVTEDEHQKALIAEVRRYPGQEQQVYDYYRKTPQALAALRAPVFENKVIDYIAELAQVTEQPMKRQEVEALIQSDDDDELDMHDHDHHDHDHHDHDHHDHDHHDHDHDDHHGHDHAR